MTQSISPLFDLTGRTALVTGGAKGLGLAMARGLADHGAAIVLADIDDETGERAAEELAAATGVSVSYRHLDVTDQTMVEGELGNFDVLLLGPQVRHILRKIKGIVGDAAPVEVIDAKAYGRGDGAAVIAQAEKLVG